MKRMAVFMWLMLLLGCVSDNRARFPGQTVGYLQKNPIYPDRYDVYRSNGQRSGIYLEPNPIYKGQMDLKTNGNFGGGTGPPKGGSSFKGGKTK